LLAAAAARWLLLLLLLCVLLLLQLLLRLLLQLLLPPSCPSALSLPSAQTNEMATYAFATTAFRNKQYLKRRIVEVSRKQTFFF
jgi:hypothetical protein